MNIAEAKRYVCKVAAETLRSDLRAALTDGRRSPFSAADQKRIVDAFRFLADELERRAFRKADG